MHSTPIVGHEVQKGRCLPFAGERTSAEQARRRFASNTHRLTKTKGPTYAKGTVWGRRIREVLMSDPYVENLKADLRRCHWR